jgi:hypothetical protein
LGRRRGETIGETTANVFDDHVNLVQCVTSGDEPPPVAHRSRIGETFTRTDANRTSAALVDALDSAPELTGASGSLQTHYTYAHSARRASQGRGITNVQQFTGRETDGTDDHYYRAQYLAV